MFQTINFIFIRRSHTHIIDEYSPIFITESIQEIRAERLAEDIAEANAAQVDKLRLKENVLERNLSPSLQKKI